MDNCGKTDVKFTITKSIDNTFVFTVKANNSTLPIEIQPTDTFRAIFRTLSGGEDVFSKDMTVENALGGRISLTITSEETKQLTAARGGVEDRYYIKPVYSLVLDCDTEANGKFLAKVDAVYVD